MIKDAKNEAILEPKETKEEPQVEKCGCICHPGFEQPPFYSNYSELKCKHCEATNV